MSTGGVRNGRQFYLMDEASDRLGWSPRAVMHQETGCLCESYSVTSKET